MSMFMPSADEMERESSSMYFCFKDELPIRLELYGTDKENVLETYRNDGYVIKEAIEVTSSLAPKYTMKGYKNGKEIK